MIQIETFEGDNIEQIRDQMNTWIGRLHAAVTPSDIRIFAQHESRRDDDGYSGNVLRWYGWIKYDAARRDLAAEPTTSKGERNAD